MKRIKCKASCIVFLVSIFGVFAAGCAGVSYQFGGAPAVLPTSDPVKQCVRQRSIVVRPAYAEFRTSENIGGGPNVTVTLVTTHRGKGYTFYRGRERLTAEQVLQVLNHPDLQAAYEGLYKETLRKGRSQVRVGGWLFLPGIAASAAGLGVMFGGMRGDGLNMTMLWSGLGISMAGILVGTIASIVLGAGIKKRNTGEVYQTIFMSGDLQPELEKAIEDYNRTVLLQCQR